MLRRPKLVMLGAALQYTVMPGLGFLISRVFQLPPAYAVGCVTSFLPFLPLRARLRAALASAHMSCCLQQAVSLSWWVEDGMERSTSRQCMFRLLTVSAREAARGMPRLCGFMWAAGSA